MIKGAECYSFGRIYFGFMIFVISNFLGFCIFRQRRISLWREISGF